MAIHGSQSLEWSGMLQPDLHHPVIDRRPGTVLLPRTPPIPTTCSPRRSAMAGATQLLAQTLSSRFPSATCRGGQGESDGVLFTSVWCGDDSAHASRRLDGGDDTTAGNLANGDGEIRPIRTRPPDHKSQETQGHHHGAPVDGDPKPACGGARLPWWQQWWIVVRVPNSGGERDGKTGAGEIFVHPRRGVDGRAKYTDHARSMEFPRRKTRSVVDDGNKGYWPMGPTRKRNRRGQRTGAGALCVSGTARVRGNGPCASAPDEAGPYDRDGATRNGWGGNGPRELSGPPVRRFGPSASHFFSIFFPCFFISIFKFKANSSLNSKLLIFIYTNKTPTLKQKYLSCVFIPFILFYFNFRYPM
jgi:hypothetical protein